MDYKTAFVRQLIGLVDPWGDRHHSNDEPIISNGDRQMYLSREHVDMMMDDVGTHNQTTTTDIGSGAFGFDDEDEQGEDVTEFMTRAPDMSVWHTMGFIMGFFFFILCILVIKDGIMKYFGIDCGSGDPDRPILPHNSQQPLDEGVLGILADDDEIGLTPDEIKERRLEKQRLERRLWYTYYLKPYITVLTAEHFRSDGDKQDQQIQDMEEGTNKDQQVVAEDSTTSPASKALDEFMIPPQSPSSGAMCVVDMEDDDDATESCSTTEADEKATNLELQRKREDNLLVCKPVGATMISEDEEEEKEEELFPIKYMTLWDAHDTTFRKLEANCSICMLDYEEGDTIVKSGADEEEEYCIHVFHLECMLQWLSHGKKRCPICRHWFVPALRIKEQMKIAHVVTRESLHHLYDSRTMQDIMSLSDDTASDMSHSFNTNDTSENIVVEHHHHPIMIAEQEQESSQPERTTTGAALRQAELPTSSTSTQIQRRHLEIDPASRENHVLGHSSSC